MKNELFETMPVPKAYMKLAVPVMMSSVLMLIYNMVDMYFIAKTGNTSLVAGVSLCAPVFTFMIAIGDIFGLGGSSLISRLFGQGKQEDGKRLSVFSFVGSALFGVLIAVVLMAARGGMLNLLGADADTYEFASQYYTWIALGAPFIIFSLVPTNLLRTEGFATGAMIGSVTGSIVNMILDPIFIFTLGMGAAGAAAATVIGNICADIFYVWFILNKSKALSLDPRGFHMSGRELKQILGIGIPSSITNIMQSIGVMLLNRYLLPYGSDKIAAMGIVSKVVMIVVMIMVAFSFGGQPLYGYLYGARNTKRMKETIRFAYKLVCGLGLGLSLILFAIAPQMIAFFMNDAHMIEVGAPMLRAVLCGMFFIGITMVTTCIFQSTGKATGAFLLSAGRQGYIYAVVLVIASAIAGYNGVICAQPIADVLAAVLAIVLYRRLLGRELA
ncbi:MAG: MATE family efflux transporter [Solobacterium sp.]|nr:MATE family efflux transporter [Solobacterium sp.]